jgi:hypothetical protein
MNPLVNGVGGDSMFDRLGSREHGVLALRKPNKVGMHSPIMPRGV